MKIFSFTGWSGSGKTTLITGLIKEIKNQGKTVVVFKHAPEKYHLEPEGKDTYNYLQAGCSEAFLVGKAETLHIKKRLDPEEVFDLMDNKIEENDFVLLEGLYPENVPVIEVYDPKKNRKFRFPKEKLAACVTKAETALGIPCFSPDDLAGLLNFIEKYPE